MKWSGHLFVVMLAASRVLAAAEKLMTVPMKWTPNDPPPTVAPIDLTGGGVYPLRIDPVVDRREKGRVIGEHPDGKNKTIPVVTNDDVGVFLTAQVKALLSRFGVEQTSDPSASRIMRLEVVDFWVIDAGHYQATTRMKTALVDGADREIWSAIVTGTGENGGRSLKLINYQEVLSNAIQSFVGNLLQADAFRKALKKTV
jgi:hypothetical protein